MAAARLLRHARRRAGLSQRALADLAGMAQPAVARIEAGGVSPSLRTLEHLLAATGHSLEVTTRLGEGVDRTLIHATLARSPEERIRAAATATRNLRTFVEATRGPQAQP